MGKKIFGIYLAKLDAPNSEAHARLELPASPWELHDAMDKVQLQENEELYLEIDDYYGFEYPERYGHAHGNPEDHGNVQLQWLMHWAQAILFCGGLIYAAVDDLRTRTVSDIVCIVIALAGLITISPASLLGALLAMLPFYLCAGFGLMGGGDWRLAAAVGFVLGVGRVLTGFLFMSVALLLASLVMRAFPALRQSAAKKQPLVPYFAVAFIPAYFL